MIALDYNSNNNRYSLVHIDINKSLNKQMAGGKETFFLYKTIPNNRYRRHEGNRKLLLKHHGHR